MAIEKTQWWLATVSDSHGITTLTDGPHDSREGVEQAAYLMRALGLQHGDKYAAAEVRLTEVTPKAHDVNNDAVNACREMLR